jgi:hypothetical protein
LAKAKQDQPLRGVLFLGATRIESNESFIGKDRIDHDRNQTTLGMAFV